MNLSAWRSQLEASLAPLRARYAALQPREQTLLVAAALVVLLALVYLAIWEPVVAARARNALSLADARQTAMQIESMATLRGNPDTGKPTLGAGSSLLSAVDQAARADKQLKAPARMQPDGDQRVQIWFEGASFDDLMAWIHTLDERYGIVVESTDISRRDKAGTVDARFALGRDK